MQSATQRIREIESIKYEISSQASNRSLQSAISNSHSTSSNKSNTPRIPVLSAKKAALKTKLKYIDLESKCLAELQKIQTIKEMEMDGAELEVLERSHDLPEPKPDIPIVK